MQITNFNATNIPPQQSAGKHPEYMGPAQISNTFGKPTKENDGGIFVIEFTSPVGSILKNYNLWNKSEKAVEIAQKELSAICHATGIFQLSMDGNNLSNAGFELRGSRLVIEVKPQANNPEYMEVKKVYDINGNEPGKAPATPQPQAQQPSQGGWGPQPNPQASTQNNAWSGGQAAQQPNNPSAGGAPPWAQK